MSNFNVHEWNRKRYLSEEEVNEVEPQTNLIGIAARTLKDMNTEEAIDAIDRLMLYLKDAKADIEYKDSGFNLNEEYTMANFRTINDFMTSMASPGGIEAFYKLPTQTKAELFRFYAEELEDDRF